MYICLCIYKDGHVKITTSLTKHCGETIEVKDESKLQYGWKGQEISALFCSYFFNRFYHFSLSSDNYDFVYICMSTGEEKLLANCL